MNEVWNSTKEWMGEKNSSPLYFTYLVFFLAWNWRMFYVLFIENGLMSSPKIEYIHNLNLFQSNTFLSWVGNISWHVIPPMFFTWIAIEYLPKIHAWAHQKHVENHFSRKEVYDKAKLKYEQGKTGKLQKEVKEKKEQSKAKQEIAKNLTQEEKWEVEFNSILGSPIYSALGSLSDIVYANSGRTHRLGNDNYYRAISPNVLALAHTNGLISIDGLGHNEKVELTEKGKFFMAQYLKRK